MDNRARSKMKIGIER